MAVLNGHISKYILTVWNLVEGNNSNIPLQIMEYIYLFILDRIAKNKQKHWYKCI